MPRFDAIRNYDGVLAIRETSFAILCDIDGERVWIPKNQIDDRSEVRGAEDEGTLVISRWIANERGLL